MSSLLKLDGLLDALAAADAARGQPDAQAKVESVAQQFSFPEVKPLLDQLGTNGKALTDAGTSTSSRANSPARPQLPSPFRGTLPLLIPSLTY